MDAEHREQTQSESGKRREWTDYREWKDAVEVDPLVLRAYLRRAFVVDCEVARDPDGSVSHIFFELHRDGEPNSFVRLSAHGVHTEGWIWADVK